MAEGGTPTLKIRLSDGLEVEGGPEEILQVIRGLGIAALEARTAQARLSDPPSNELLLHEYGQVSGLSRKTRDRYTSVARDLDRLVSPKSLLDLDAHDALRYERQLLDRCADLQQSVLTGRSRTGAQKHRCRRGLYSWTLARPDACSTTCPLFRRQKSGPDAALKAARHFYAWLGERGMIRDNPFTAVAKRRSRITTRRHGAEKAKYCPTTEEVRAILRTAVRILNPRDAGILLALAKLGRRPGHVLLLHASDLVGLDEGPLAWADFAGVKERVLARNLDGYDKLQGNLISPIDEEFRAFLREQLLPWRARRWPYQGDAAPLFPNEQGGGHIRSHRIVSLALERVLEHLRDSAPTDGERLHWVSRMEPGGRSEILPGGFRHYFTTTLEEFGVPREWARRLRGDKIPGADEAYRHVRHVEDLFRHYRLPPLLTS